MDDAASSAALRRQAPAVSFPSEELVIVDGEDRPRGFGTKERLHAGKGLLHRAFSVFLFDRQQRVLLHRRSGEKPLWPGFWTNSCCSHPRRGEQLESAVRRRLSEELGVRASDMQRVYAFEYHANFKGIGSEHEFCHVYLARLMSTQHVTVHAAEIAEWGWFTMEEVDALVKGPREWLTPWFCMEWEALRSSYRSILGQFTTQGLDPRSAA